jgi:phosphoribosyl-ATP pyrophosphohydrolase
VEEIADLAYHVLVLMVAKGIKPEDVAAELAKRKK